MEPNLTSLPTSLVVGLRVVVGTVVAGLGAATGVLAC